MYKDYVLKALLLPAATLVSEDQNTPANEPCTCEPKCKPSELPIYCPESQTNQQTQNASSTPGAIEGTISIVRHQLTTVFDEVQAYQRVAGDYFREGMCNAESFLKYLREEDNTTPKAGAIAIGGLTGLVFGLRGGFLKRTIYATTGALAMTSVCYPNEAGYYSSIGFTETKKYAKIAYNFAYGVKKDDPPLELPTLPQLPSSLSEMWNDISKTASNLVLGEGGKGDQATPQPAKK